MQNPVEVDRLLITKNTFIALTLPDRSPSSTRRSQSLPSSPRRFFDFDGTDSPVHQDGTSSPVQQDGTNSPVLKYFIGDSEASTDAATEASDDDLESTLRAQLWWNTERPLNADAPAFVPTASEKPVVCQGCTPLRLNTSAAAFKPLAQEEPVQQQYKHHFAKVLNYIVATLEEYQMIRSYEVSDDLHDCSLIVKLHDNDPSSVDNVLYYAKEALLESASLSKCIYALGYCTPSPFTVTAQGFEVTLGAMENASTACWHLFKKGFCRHGDECNKAHPACKVRFRMLVETAMLSTYPPEAMDFQLQACDLVTDVLSSLKSNPHVQSADAWKDADTKCWSIQLSPKEGGKKHKEYVMTLAKNAFYEVSNNSSSIYMLGYDAKPFIKKSDGFALMLANVRSDSRTCWSFYSCGVCKKEGCCQYEHPTCLMPVSVNVQSF